MSLARRFSHFAWSLIPWRRRHQRPGSTRSSVFRWLVRGLAGLLLLASMGNAFAADIYGYVDDKGVAHFAAEKLDERYQVFFRGGQDFDTADGISPLGRSGAIGRSDEPAGKVSPASQTLLAMFEASPSYKTAKAALRDAAKTYAIDYELLQALIATESGFDAQAISPKGAIGLMQLMPGTAQRYGVQGDPKRSLETKLADPRVNIGAGARYLRDLIKMFPGEIELALAAYNAGEGAVQRAGNKIPNYRETQNYVKTVLQLYAYLKPAATSRHYGVGSGQAPGRVRMELDVPQGGALRRGNMPSQQTVPTVPAPASPTTPAPLAAPTEPVARD